MIFPLKYQVSSYERRRTIGRTDGWIDMSSVLQDTPLTGFLYQNQKRGAKQKNAEPGILFSRLETAMMRLWIWYVLSWMLIRLQAVVLGPVVLLMFWRWSQITIITTTSTVTIATKSLMPPEWKQIIPSLFVVVFIFSVFFFSFVRKTSFPYMLFFHIIFVWTFKQAIR